MGRDLTGTVASGQLLTGEPTAELELTNVLGREVPTPVRPKRMSIREYRERYDSTRHVVEVHGDDGRVVARARLAGAVSAAVYCHSLNLLETRMTIRPEATRR